MRVTGFLLNVNPQFALSGMNFVNEAVLLPSSFSLVALAKTEKYRPKGVKRASDWRTLNSIPLTRASPALCVVVTFHPTYRASRPNSCTSSRVATPTLWPKKSVISFRNTPALITPPLSV
jgi:hypothetical protein